MLKVNESDNWKVRHISIKSSKFQSFYSISWPYVVSIVDILIKATVMKITTEVKIRRRNWIKHVLKMKEDSHCLSALTWTPEGKRKVVHPKTTW